MMANPSRSMMKFRASISRRDRLENKSGIISGPTDGYGHAAKTADHPTGWSTVHSALACNVFRHNGRRAISDQRTASIETMILAVPLGTDLQEGDRVDEVRDRIGNVLYGPLQVGPVINRIRYIDSQLLEVDRGAN
jgi:hypothetical protein